jgi:hypothetical protein
MLSETPEKIDYCPIASVHIRGPCNIRSCMYHKGPDSNPCIAKEVRELQEDDKSRKRQVMKLYKIDEEELDHKVEFIQEVIVAYKFFEHVHEKSLLEARATDLDSIENKEEAFKNWAKNRKIRTPFSKLLSTYNFLRKEMK